MSIYEVSSVDLQDFPSMTTYEQRVVSDLRVLQLYAQYSVRTRNDVPISIFPSYPQGIRESIAVDSPSLEQRNLPDGTDLSIVHFVASKRL